MIYRCEVSLSNEKLFKVNNFYTIEDDTRSFIFLYTEQSRINKNEFFFKFYDEFESLSFFGKIFKIIDFNNNGAEVGVILTLEEVIAMF